MLDILFSNSFHKTLRDVKKLKNAYILKNKIFNKIIELVGPVQNTSSYQENIHFKDGTVAE